MMDRTDRARSRPAHRTTSAWLAVVLTAAMAACGGEGAADGAAGAGAAMTADGPARTTLIELWSDGVPAFGVFVPSERERGARGPNGERLPPLYTAAGGERLAADPLLDYVFLNLEGSYDVEAIRAIRQGLDAPGAVSEKTLLVRIPPISDDAPAARMRIAEALEAGADGVVVPHVRSVDEARVAVSYFEEAGADVWSPTNPDGTVIAMLMIEDPGALAEAAQIADVEGYSVLACGIGSLTQALGGDRAAGEAGNQAVLREAKRVGLPDMITANADDVARRIEEGFLGLLMNGPDAGEHIRVGRAAAGR